MRATLPALVLAALFAACSTGAGASVAPASVPATTAPASAQPSAPSAQPSAGGSVTVYSGRSEALVGPLLERFTADTGIKVNVKYAGTSELASTILEEGDNSPADVFFAQDAGALGAVAAEGRLAALPSDLLDRVEARFRSPDGNWAGVSGRARVAVYDTRKLEPADMPASILDFTAPEWKDRLGWAPTNASLHSFVTALRVLNGEAAAKSWLEGIKANGVKAYESNGAVLQAVADGEIEVGFVNHYYLLGQLKEQGASFPVANHFFPAGDPGTLINVAGAGILTTSKNPANAEAFVRYLLSDAAQAYFAEETYEYPLVAGATPPAGTPPLAEIASPDLDLSDLSDLEATLDLLRDVGIL